MFEDEVDFAFLFEGLLDVDHVVALQHFEHLDLALDGPAGKLVFIRLLELLDGDSLSQDVLSPLVSLLSAFQTIP